MASFFLAFPTSGQAFSYNIEKTGIFRPGMTSLKVNNSGVYGQFLISAKITDENQMKSRKNCSVENGSRGICSLGT